MTTYIDIITQSSMGMKTKMMDRRGKCRVRSIIEAMTAPEAPMAFEGMPGCMAVSARSHTDMLKTQAAR